MYTSGVLILKQKIIIQNKQLNYIQYKYVIFSDTMRANNSQSCSSNKNIKSSKVKSPHCSSGQSLKKIKQNKNNKSNQKNNILTNAKNLSQQQKQTQGRFQYFNQEKITATKKVVCNKNEDYCSDYGNKAKQPHTQKGKNKDTAFNKLKIPNVKGAITFDGKIVAIETESESRRGYHNQSRSIQQFTEIIQKSQSSKLNIKKPKSKSQPKKSRNKSNKQKQKNMGNLILKQISKTKEPYCNNNIQLKENEQTQVSFQPEELKNFQIQNMRHLLKQNRTNQLHINYLKKINKSTRSQYLVYMSKFCFQMKLHKDVYYLAVLLVDRYLNDQIMLNKHKVLALSTILLCLKLDDSYTSKLLNFQIINPQKRKIDIQNTQAKPQKQKKYRTQSQKQKQQQQLANINQLLRTLDKNLQTEFKTNPKAEQIIQFQTLILIKQEFKIRKNDLAFWIDFITLLWDRYLMRNSANSAFGRRFYFKSVENPQNYFYLMQIIEAALHNIEIYMYNFPDIVLSCIFVICKSRLEQPQHTLDQTSSQIQKSHNFLIRDKYGQTKLFLNFLQTIQIQIGDILPCCKFMSCYLSTKLLSKVDFHQFKELCAGDFRVGFHRHYYGQGLGGGGGGARSL